MSKISLGSVIYSAVKPIFKIYFIIGLGFLMGKRNVLTVETSRNISDIVLTAILPCLIFSKIVVNIDNSDIKQIGIIFLNAVFLFGSGGLGSYLVYLLTPVPKTWLGGCLSVGFFPNISDLPILYIQTLDTGTVFTSAEGDKGVAYICIFLALQTIFQFNLGGYRLIQLDFDKLLKDMQHDEEKNSTLDENNIVESSDQTIDEDAVSLTSLSSDDDSPSQSQSRLGPRSSNPKRVRNNNNEDELHQSFLTQRRKSSRALSISTSNASYTTSIRNIDLRKLPSQGINDLVHEYSQVENLKNNHQLTPSAFTELSVKPTNPVVKNSTNDGDGDDDDDDDDGKGNISISKMITIQFVQIFENFKRPPSIALILSITISMIPWVKALFTKTHQLHIHPAPDGLPPLSFIIDLTQYIANACVPLGLMLLGLTLSRLQVADMPKGFWKVSIALTGLRLIFLPVIGVAFVNKLQRNGWFDGDNILLFVCAISFGLPNATALIYLTAFYTPPESDLHLQMDYLSLTYIYQYPLLAISLPFLTTFVLKVLLKV